MMNQKKPAKKTKLKLCSACNRPLMNDRCMDTKCTNYKEPKQRKFVGFLAVNGVVKKFGNDFN